MSIKIKVQEALQAKQSCEKLLKGSYKAKTAFKLLQLQKELIIAEQNFNEVRENTVKKYALKDEAGEPIIEDLGDGKSFVSVDPDKRLECTREITEALEQEIEISEIYFSIEDFGDGLIVAEDLNGLLPFITE
jgi:predicted nucleic acid-binding protein